MADSMPRFIALHNITIRTYLQFVEEEGDLHGFLRFSGNEVWSPYTKFQVERAKSSEELVHIKSCYNNKYLVRTSNQENSWFVAGADEPEEDQSKWSCTLLLPQLQSTLDGNRRYTFRVIPSSPTTFLSFHRGAQNQQYRDCLVSHRTPIVITVIDMELLAILPRYFTIKGDNGKYLRSRMIQGREHQEYTSDNIRDPAGHYEAFTTPDGNVRIRSKFFSKFWTRSGSSNWILASSSDTTANNLNTLFRPIRLGSLHPGNKFIALRNVGNSLFCKRQTDNILSASARDVEPEAEIEIGEAVRAREIYDVFYRTGDARIYDSRPGIILTKDVMNRSPTSTQTGEVPFTYTETHTETWDSSHSWKVGVTINIRAGIPFVADKQISIEAAYEGQISWGETKETSTEIGTKVEVEVPPMTMLRVGMVIAKAVIDVPFSYTQRDTLLDGSVVTTRMHDGCFTGVNTHVSYDIKEEPISSTSLPAPAAKL